MNDDDRQHEIDADAHRIIAGAGMVPVVIGVLLALGILGGVLAVVASRS